jgi:hypothetical protein
MILLLWIFHLVNNQNMSYYLMIREKNLQNIFIYS